MKSILFNYLNKYTTLSEEEQQAIVDGIPTGEFPKGTVLLRQGEATSKCYFVLKGCVRSFSVDEEGREVTSNFYTEEQALSMMTPDTPSKYTFACLEDCVLVVGELQNERRMFDQYPQLEVMTLRMIEQMFLQVQDEFAAFIASSPEERFRTLLRERPELLERVPQHHLASYLGMTPESLSRIKKRVQSRFGSSKLPAPEQKPQAEA